MYEQEREREAPIACNNVNIEALSFRSGFRLTGSGFNPDYEPIEKLWNRLHPGKVQIHIARVYISILDPTSTLHLNGKYCIIQ